MVHTRETTVKHGRLTRRTWYGTKMLLNSAFEQQTGSGLVFFFFRFWGHSPAYGQKARKNRVRIRFMKTWYGKFMQQKYLTILWVRTHFFFSVV